MFDINAGCDDLSSSRNDKEQLANAKDASGEKRKRDHENATNDQAKQDTEPKKSKMTFSLKSSAETKKTGNILIKLGSQVSEYFLNGNK